MLQQNSTQLWIFISNTQGLSKVKMIKYNVNIYNETHITF